MDYTFTVTEGEMGIVASALMELPYKTVAPLFDKLNAQITEQQQKEKEEKAKALAEKEEETPPAE